MPPIIVNKPVEMLYVNIVVPRENIEYVTSVLHELGAVHVERLGERIEEYVKRYEKANELIEKIRSLLSNVRGISVDVELTRQELEAIDLDYMEKDVGELYNVVEALLDKQRDLEERLRVVREAIGTLSLIPSNFRLGDLYFRGRIISSLTVKGRLDALKQFLNQFKERINLMYYAEYEQTGLAILVCYTRELEDLLERVKSLGLTIFDPRNLFDEVTSDMTVAGVLEKINSVIKEYEKELKKISSKVYEEIKGSVNDLCKYLVILENMVSRLNALLSIKSWKYLSLIGGWIPKKKVKELTTRLSQRQIPFYVETREPIYGRDEPPTLLENPPVIQWYEPIVKFIGLPRYWEWDPTPIIAYSFALFFGMMLGDMGYATALIIATLLFLDKFVSDPSNRDYQFFKKALILSSLIGFIFGFLGGAVFGFQLFVITDLFTDPMKFLVTALVVGLIHVNISHALTLVKSIREKNVGVALSEIGLFIAELFGIPYILYTMLNTPLPGLPTWIYTYFLYLSFVGVALIVVGMIKSIGGLGLLMWLFSLTGLLGDVLSYSRLAGVGLATIYLGASFNTIALLAFNGLKSMVPVEIAGAILGGVVAGITLFFGHLLNTILSAIGGFIHGLRLCFVEFLSKFYEGTGYPFEPLRIVLRRRVVIE